MVLHLMGNPFEGTCYGSLKWDCHMQDVEYAVRVAQQAHRVLAHEPELARKAEFYAGLDDEEVGASTSDALPSARPAKRPFTLIPSQVRDHSNTGNHPFEPQNIDPRDDFQHDIPPDDWPDDVAPF